MTAPRVSIAILTHDGIGLLPAVLEAVASQDFEGGFEVVAVDTASTDGTLELLEGTVDELVRISADDFDHGLTRNLAIERTRGELVVLLVQDAVPASPRWLAELTRPLEGDPQLAGTFARQLPRPQASRVARLNLARWLASQEEPRLSSIPDPAAFAAMHPMDRFTTCVFDNVCSCIRRSVWQEHPFMPAVIAEDLEWARDVLVAGLKLAYVPTAAVVHSHDRGTAYELRRTILVHRRLAELFGVRTVPTMAKLLRAWTVTLGDHLRCLTAPGERRPGPVEILRTLGLAFVWPLGQYIGGRGSGSGS